MNGTSVQPDSDIIEAVPEPTAPRSDSETACRFRSADCQACDCRTCDKAIEADWDRT